MTPVSSSSESAGVLPWDPNRWVRTVDSLEAKYSRGFLRCEPGRWFPGIGAHWTPLFHSLSAEIRIQELKPLLKIPEEARSGFVCSYEDEPIAVLLDEISRSNILETVVPSASQASRRVTFEYLVRRLLTSLAMCWSGIDPSALRFEKEMDVSQVKTQAAIRLALTVNGQKAAVWFGLGRALAERLDGLWRRQMQGASAQKRGPTPIFAEITRLAVAPYALSDYLKPGTMIDLELPLSSQVTIFANNQPWLQSKLCSVNGKLAFETVSNSASVMEMPQGSTALSVQFGSFSLDSAGWPEYQQPGAILESPLAVSDKVQVNIHGDTVCQARLCSYEGRFAVSIL